MTSPNSQTWSWYPEHEPPKAFEEALALCPYACSIDFGSVLIQGYAQKVNQVYNVTRLTRPIIDYSERSGCITLKSRYTQHESYFIVNCPVVYWPRPKKETP